MARYIAKNIVAAEFASKCQVSLAYAIGVAEPVMIEDVYKRQGRYPVQSTESAGEKSK